MKIYFGKTEKKVYSIRFTLDVECLTVVHTISVGIESSYTYKFQFCFLVCNFIHS